MWPALGSLGVSLVLTVLLTGPIWARHGPGDDTGIDSRLLTDEPNRAPASAGVGSLDPDAWARAPGRFIVLRLGEGLSSLHVPAPPNTLLRVKTARIIVNYNPASCEGVTRPWPQTAKDAVEHAVGIWESLLQANQTIVSDACWRTDLAPGVLGSASATEVRGGSPAVPRWYPVALANELAGGDLNGDRSEVLANFNGAYDWYLGTDGRPGSRLDLATVVLHELAHGLGFGGSMMVFGGQGGWGLALSGDPTFYPYAYDTFSQDGTGISLLDTSVYPNPSAALARALTGGNIYFDGPNANAANGGARVRLYAPDPWLHGSSYAHLDELYNDTVNALMTHSQAKGESIHHPGPVTLGIFQDLGWATMAGPTATPTATRTPTLTGEPSATPTVESSGTPTMKPSRTPTVGPSATERLPGTPTVCLSYLSLLLKSGDVSKLPTPTPTAIPTSTRSPSRTPTSTRTPMATPTETTTPTPTTAPCAADVGFWEDGWVEFYVTDRCRVKGFAIYLYVEGCGGYKIIHTSEERINDGFFNFQGEYTANGTFTDRTRCKGRVNITDLFIPGCGTVSGRISDYTAAWERKHLVVAATEAGTGTDPIQSVGADANDLFRVVQLVETDPDN